MKGERGRQLARRRPRDCSRRIQRTGTRSSPGGLSPHDWPDDGLSSSYSPLRGEGVAPSNGFPCPRVRFLPPAKSCSRVRGKRTLLAFGRAREGGSVKAPGEVPGHSPRHLAGPPGEGEVGSVGARVRSATERDFTRPLRVG